MAKNRAVFKHKLPSGKYINTHRYHQLNSRQKRRINYRINYDPTVTGITWFLVGFLGFLAIYSAKIKIEKDVVSLVNSQSNKIDKKLQPTKFQQISHRWLLGHSSGVNVPLNTLFADLNSLGALSICAAEGNCETNGRRTSLIAGHFDPATGILNKGFCSNHGRGGTLQEANQWCLQHLRSRSFVIEQQFREVGINPNSHLEGFINAIDLWNQSPYFGAKFPQLYASELRGRKKGTDAILSARVNSFKINGSYEQTTLAHPPICPYSIDAKSCVRHDQSRRMNAISGVMEHLGLK
ncbi:hypothetical protein [Limnospira indica]|uniref:hypothetical protein n=1 Tax=Limnospira indica TaxID=147322 RepID=UPI0018613BC2|nr:hypothetical protein [Limnospira indica]QNH59902.1 MAG: hypothetical protein H2674_12655 [Limnospira indica BM01]